VVSWHSQVSWPWKSRPDSHGQIACRAGDVRAAIRLNVRLPRRMETLDVGPRLLNVVAGAVTGHSAYARRDDQTLHARRPSQVAHI
jgi:hypothetical protein